MPEPYCLAMVICDDVHKDPSTSKHTILGTCNVFVAREFPATIKFAVYTAITDALGPLDVVFRLVKADFDEEPVFSLPPQEITVASPLMVLETVMRVMAQVPEPGQYHCELLANGELLMARRLVIMDSETLKGRIDDNNT